jgi:uncharacterized membrane protein SirB2
VYLALKHFHMTCAGLSLLLFLLRGAWVVYSPARMRSGFARVVPHVVDTLQLASGVGLMFVTRQFPIQQSWLTAKLIGVVIYILLGTIALKPGRSPAVRGTAFVAAVAVFFWIVATARAHAPWMIPV